MKLLRKRLAAVLQGNITLATTTILLLVKEHHGRWKPTVDPLKNIIKALFYYRKHGTPLPTTPEAIVSMRADARRAPCGDPPRAAGAAAATDREWLARRAD